MTNLIILALISILLFVRLFFLFGQKRDIHSRTRYSCGDRSCSSSGAIKEAEVNIAKITDPLSRIKALNPSFKMDKFLQEAQDHYRKILYCYAKGDTQTLSDYLNIEMLRKFAYAVANREESALLAEIEVLKIKDAVASDVTCDEDGRAKIKVIFHSDVIHFVTDKHHKIFSGCKTKVDTREDIWVFAKNLNHAGQKWYVVEISQLIQ